MRLRWTTFVCVLAVLLAACGGNSSEAPGEAYADQSRKAQDETEVRVTSEQAWELILEAIDLDDGEKLSRVLKGGDFANLAREEAWTPMHFAARAGADRCVGVLAAAGADLDAENAPGGTPLFLAVAGDRISTVRLLIELGADLTKPIFNDSNLLLIAISFGRPELVKLLIEEGFDPIDPKLQPSPLVTAAACADSEPGLEVLRVILDRLAPGQVDLASAGGSTPLVRAAFHGNHQAIELLIEYGADPHYVKPGGWSVIGEAAMGGAPKAVEVLLRHGVSPDLRDGLGRKPLHVAANSYALEVMRVLLDAGCDVNAVDESGLTALHYAAQREHPEAVRLLLDRGADKHARNHAGRRPVDMTDCAETRIQLEGA